MIAFRTAERSVFLYGFAKNERANIDATELADLKKLASLVLGYTEDQIAKAMAEQELKEVPYADDEEEHGR